MENLSFGLTRCFAYTFNLAYCYELYHDYGLKVLLLMIVVCITGGLCIVVYMYDIVAQ